MSMPASMPARPMQRPMNMPARPQPQQPQQQIQNQFNSLSLSATPTNPTLATNPTLNPTNPTLNPTMNPMNPTLPMNMNSSTRFQQIHPQTQTQTQSHGPHPPPHQPPHQNQNQFQNQFQPIISQQNQQMQQQMQPNGYAQQGFQQQTPPPPNQFQPLLSNYQQMQTPMQTPMQAPMQAPMQFQQAPLPPMQFQQQQQQQQRGPGGINPDSIPSVVEVRCLDQELYNSTPFFTSSRTVPPLSSTAFKTIDQGNASPRFIRSSLYTIPATDEMVKTCAIPFGVTIQPLAELGHDEDPIPVVDFGGEGPVRCSRCQAYANPYFQFINGGRLFICNLCSFSNEVPSSYFSNLDMSGRRIDIQQRPELILGSCEFAVHGAYCLRPPRPVSFLFALDVSMLARQSGMVRVFSDALKYFLYAGVYRLPPGARVGIFSFDKALHFYNLTAGLERFQMMVVGDVTDSFCPIQEGLLVDPVESRTLIEELLDALPNLFTSTGAVEESAAGSACKVGFEGLKKSGGKLCVFMAQLPGIGEGVLSPREDAKILGTDKEKSLFEPQEYFWTKLGQECAVNGVCVDMYMFPANGYIDVATTGAISALSGGEIYYYSQFEASKQGIKFANDLQRALGRPFGYEGLLRVRVSNGLKIDDYLGNFYMKNATDIECAGINSLKSFIAILKHDSGAKLEENAESFIQAALLYTTSDGQRRVRVHNLAFSNSSNYESVFRNSSVEGVVSILSRQMIQQAYTVPLSFLRTSLLGSIAKILAAFRQYAAKQPARGQLVLPETLKLGPILALSLLKNRAFRGGRIASSDLRVYSMRLLNGLNVSELMAYLYAQVYDCSYPIEKEGGEFPVVRISTKRLLTNGIYLAENGRHLFMFVGKDVDSARLSSIFGYSNLQSIPLSYELPALDTSHSHQIRRAIETMRASRPRFMHLNICRQGLDGACEARFANLMIEDGNFEGPSYADYIVQVHRSIEKDLSAVGGR